MRCLKKRPRFVLCIVSGTNAAESDAQNTVDKNAQSVTTTTKRADVKKEVDPADITRVISGIKVLGGFNGHKGAKAVEVELRMGGQIHKGNEFLTMLNIQSAEKKAYPDQDDFGVREVRGRWFQVFDTDNATMSRLGYSVDLINRSNDDSDPIDNIVAAGVVGKIAVNKAYSIYPNVAIVSAFNKDKYKSVLGTRDGLGFQVNLFNSLYLNKKGTYVMINPQYSYIDFDSYISQNLMLEVQFGTPLTTDRRLWLAATYQENFSDVNSDNPALETRFRANDDTRHYRIGLSYYF